MKVDLLRWRCVNEPSAFLLHCVVVVISLLFFPGALAFLATFCIFVATPELADAPARLHAVAKHRDIIADLMLHNNKQSESSNKYI